MHTIFRPCLRLVIFTVAGRKCVRPTGSKRPTVTGSSNTASPPETRMWAPRASRHAEINRSAHRCASSADDRGPFDMIHL